MERERIFSFEGTPVKFGAGASEEAGWELRRLGATRVLLVTDPGVAALGHPERVAAQIHAEGIEVVLFDRARVEPTDASMEEAAAFARDQAVDGFVSVGGGSAMDTAKVANLLTAHPAPLMDYVNAPVGGGRTPPGPLLPHLAIPTTSGTGSEATTVAVLDLPALGICRGMQMLNVACGGTIDQHVPDRLGGDVLHREVPGTYSEHGVEIIAGTLAARNRSLLARRRQGRR